MTVDDVIQLLRERGDSQYGGEPVSQLEHALQCAALAQQNGAAPSLVAAALLHDIGHLVHHLPDDAPDAGIDDVREDGGREFLGQIFPDEVTEPVALHVAAKRYLCGVDPEYCSQLSAASQCSLALQGGSMSPTEIRAFESRRYSKDAVQLRRWDDMAKVPQLNVPSLDHYSALLKSLAGRQG